jgi:hypothetical protein
VSIIASAAVEVVALPGDTSNFRSGSLRQFVHATTGSGVSVFLLRDPRKVVAHHVVHGRTALHGLVARGVEQRFIDGEGWFFIGASTCTLDAWKRPIAPGSPPRSPLTPPS